MCLGVVAGAHRIVIAAAVIKARIDHKKLRDPRAKGCDDADGKEGNTKKAL
jgi:hypothetical protein